MPVIDPKFPIFTLCGVVMSDEQLKSLENEVKKLKRAPFFLLNDKKDADAIHVVIEKRGKKEDNKLLAFYNQLLDRGTYWTTPERINSYFKSYKMKPKSDDVTGLQIADLVAYPITRHALEPDFANPAYDIIAPKIYQFKTFPQPPVA